MSDEARDHPPLSWWRHEPQRTATGYRWLDWMTKPYWRAWLWWHTHLFWKTIDEKFPLSDTEMDLIECRAVLAELWDVSVVKQHQPNGRLLWAVARQMYPSGENQDAI